MVHVFVPNCHSVCYLLSLFHLVILQFFCLYLWLKLCQIRWSQSHKSLPCHCQETSQTTPCSLINHLLLSQERKRSPLTTTTTNDKPSWEVNKKSNMLVFLLWGREMRRRLSSIMTHYLRYNDRLLCTMLIDCFQTYAMPCVFPIGPLLGWFHVVWPQHNIISPKCK